MKPRLTAIRPARDLIKAYEPYLAEARPRGRRWVVGYGHTTAAREGLSLSREDAELLLIHDALQADKQVRALAPNLPDASRNALVSFACSVGPGAFKVSDVARLAAAGRHDEAAQAMLSWVRVEREGRVVVSEALSERRRAENALYLEGFGKQLAAGEARTPASGPLIDLEIEFIIPSDEQARPATALPSTPDPVPEADQPSTEELSEPDRAEQDEEPAKEASEPSPASAPAPVAAREPQTAGEAEEARKAQAEAVRAVMARMAAHIAGDVRESAARRPDAEPRGDADDAASPESDPRPAPSDEHPADADHFEPPREGAPVKLGFSYLEAGEAGEPLPDAPARTPDQAARTPLKSSRLFRRKPRFSRRRALGESRFFLAANLIIGLALAGVGAWDVLVQLDAYQTGRQPWLGFGPVLAAIGLALAAVSAVLLARSARRPAA